MEIRRRDGVLPRLVIPGRLPDVRRGLQKSTGCGRPARLCEQSRGTPSCICAFAFGSPTAHGPCSGATLLLAEACSLGHTQRMKAGAQQRRKRCKRWDVPFSAHALTFSCFGQQPFLRSARACKWFLDSLQRARAKTPFDLWAYVIMPEPVHLLLLPHQGTTISATLASLKLSMTRKALNWVRRNSPRFLARMEQRQGGVVRHRFWLPGGGYDRNLRSPHDVHEKIRYIHANPVRRGLVARPEDWPWSSARAHLHGADEPIPIDGDTVPSVVS